MPHSRAYYVLIVGVCALTLCEPFTTKVMLPQQVDVIADVVWLFVQGATAWCVGADLTQWMVGKWRTN